MHLGRLVLAFLFFVSIAQHNSLRADILSQWQTRTLTVTNDSYWGIGAVAYGNGTFVAVGESGDLGTVFTSPDGVTWTYRGWVFGQYQLISITSITFAEGLFVGAGWNGTVSTSTDGVAWSQQFIANGTTFSDIAYGGGRFVAVGFKFSDSGGNTNTAFFDGTSWTLRTSPAIFTDLRGVTYGSNNYVAVGPQGAIRSLGTNWTGFSSIPFADVVFGNGVFVFTSETNGIYVANPSLLTSIQSVTNFGVRCITFADGMFFAINKSGTAMYTSTNGTNWVARDLNPALLSFNFPPSGLTKGTGTLVAVGYKNVYQSPTFAGIQPGTTSGEAMVSGIIGARYGIQSRAAFGAGSPWINAGTLTLTNSPQRWLDPAASTNALHFYRSYYSPLP